MQLLHRRIVDVLRARRDGDARPFVSGGFVAEMSGVRSGGRP
jgi:hypothetical protein